MMMCYAYNSFQAYTSGTMRSTRANEIGYIWYENNKRIMEDTEYQEQKLGSSNWGMKIKNVSSSYKPKT
jgi:hypothetical protein